MSEDGRLHRIAEIRSRGTDLDRDIGIFSIELHWRDQTLAHSIMTLSDDSDFVSRHRLADSFCALADKLRAGPPPGTPSEPRIGACVPILFPGERLSV